MKPPFLQSLFILYFLADYSTVGEPELVFSLWERINSIKMNLQMRINYIICVLLQIYPAYPDLRSLHFYINCLNKTTKMVVQKIEHVREKKKKKTQAKNRTKHQNKKPQNQTKHAANSEIVFCVQLIYINLKL